jgi:hypothetical protein
MLVLLTGAARAAEPCSASAAELTETIEAAQRSLEHLEPDQFVQATDRLDGLLPCLAEPLSRHLAAEVHRTKGIRAVSERDPGASRFFAAARALEPAYKLPSTLIPEGHPVRTEYAAFDLTTGGFEPLPPPAEGTLTLDASPKLYRPTSWPTIAQYLGADGSVRFTAYLEPDALVPEYPLAGTVAPAPAPLPLPAPVPGPAPVPVPPRTSAKVPLGVAAVSGTALTGVLVGLAGVASARFADLDTPDEDLLALRSRANSLVAASAFTGAASLGFGIAFVAVK